MPHMAASCAVTAGRKPAWADVLSGFRHLATESTLVWSICQRVPCLMLFGEAVQESKGCVPERSTKAEQQACNQAASPERAEVEPQKPERGLT